jgi:hypothetical protein
VCFVARIDRRMAPHAFIQGEVAIFSTGAATQIPDYRIPRYHQQRLNDGDAVGTVTNVQHQPKQVGGLHHLRAAVGGIDSAWW